MRLDYCTFYAKINLRFSIFLRARNLPDNWAWATTTTNSLFINIVDKNKYGLKCKIFINLSCSIWLCMWNWEWHIALFCSRLTFSHRTERTDIWHLFWLLDEARQLRTTCCSIDSCRRNTWSGTMRNNVGVTYPLSFGLWRVIWCAHSKSTLTFLDFRNFLSRNIVWFYFCS